MKKEFLVLKGLEDLFEEKYKYFFFKERFKVLGSYQGYLPEFRYNIKDSVVSIKLGKTYDKLYTAIDVVPEKQKIKTRQLIFFDNLNLQVDEIIDAYILKYHTKSQNEHVINNVKELYKIPRELEDVEKAVKINVIGPFGDIKKRYATKEYFYYLSLVNN